MGGKGEMDWVRRRRGGGMDWVRGGDEWRGDGWEGGDGLGEGGG